MNNMANAGTGVSSIQLMFTHNQDVMADLSEDIRQERRTNDERTFVAEQARLTFQRRDFARVVHI